MHRIAALVYCFTLQEGRNNELLQDQDQPTSCSEAQLQNCRGNNGNSFRWKLNVG